MTNKLDEMYMNRAFELARQALGRTSPNPMVGAVLVKDGRIVGQGFHARAGQPHAEVNAIRAAGEEARDSVLYINLEPCCHQGKTPPCVDTVIAAGVKKVVASMADPNPCVAGQGFACLEAAGIEVECGLMESEARQLNEVFIKHITAGRPFVALKSAMTLDGKIATASGDSRWISNEKSRRFAHELRDQYDSILVGAGTVLKDDPMLNTRLDRADSQNPVRVVLDGLLDMPVESRLVGSAGDIPTMVFCSMEAEENRARRLQNQGVIVERVPGLPFSLDLQAVLNMLNEKCITSVLVEGGSEVNASFLKARLVDKVFWIIAPKIFGGRTAPTPVSGCGVDRVDKAIHLTNIEVQRFDEDFCVSAYPVY